MSLFGYAKAHSSLPHSRRKGSQSKRSKSNASAPVLTGLTPKAEPEKDGEVNRMKNEFAAMMAKWGDIQQRLVDTLDTPRPNPPNTDAQSMSLSSSNTKFTRTGTRSATPPPTTNRMGELSISSLMTSPGNNVIVEMSEDDNEVDEAAEMEKAAEAERQRKAEEETAMELEQQRRTIAHLKEKVVSLAKEKDDLMIQTVQTAADQSSHIAGTKSAVEQMAVSLTTLQRGMAEMNELKQSTSEVEPVQSVTKQDLEALATNQSAERKQLTEWLGKQDDIAELKQQNEVKDAIIAETNAELQQMAAKLSAMQRKWRKRAEVERVTTKQGTLTKVQGQSMEKLSLGRKSRKHVFFAGNRMFWSDKANATYKSIEVREVLNRVVVTAEKLKKMNNESIQKHTQRPWFLVIGQRRCALFEAESKADRDEWVAFIRHALRNSRKSVE